MLDEQCGSALAFLGATSSVSMRGVSESDEIVGSRVLEGGGLVGPLDSVAALVLEGRDLLRPTSSKARRERAVSVSPLVSIEEIDDWEMYFEWDSTFRMETAHCVQVPFLRWPHPDGGEEAIASLAAYLTSMVVGLNSDLCMVEGLTLRSDDAVRQWHVNEQRARQDFLRSLESDGGIADDEGDAGSTGDEARQEADCERDEPTS